MGLVKLTLAPVSWHRRQLIVLLFNMPVPYTARVVDRFPPEQRMLVLAIENLCAREARDGGGRGRRWLPQTRVPDPRLLTKQAGSRARRDEGERPNLSQILNPFCVRRRHRRLRRRGREKGRGNSFEGGGRTVSQWAEELVNGLAL